MRFLLPIRCTFGPHTGYTSLEDTPFFIRVLRPCGMAGTVHLTTYTLQYRFGKREGQLTFCWRPNVTWYYLTFKGFKS